MKGDFRLDNPKREDDYVSSITPTAGGECPPREITTFSYRALKDGGQYAGVTQVSPMSAPAASCSHVCALSYQMILLMKSTPLFLYQCHLFVVLHVGIVSNVLCFNVAGQFLFLIPNILSIPHGSTRHHYLSNIKYIYNIPLSLYKSKNSICTSIYFQITYLCGFFLNKYFKNSRGKKRNATMTKVYPDKGFFFFSPRLSPSNCNSVFVHSQNHLPFLSFYQSVA